MGYDIHISRAENWFDEEENFVTLDEIISVWDELPEGFSIDRDGEVYSNPIEDGSVLVAKADDFIVYRFGDSEEDKAHIYFGEDSAPNFNGGIFAGREEELVPLIKLAELVGARLQGDDGEIYDEEHPDGYFSEKEDNGVKKNSRNENGRKRSWVTGTVIRTNVWIYFTGAVISLVLCIVFMLSSQIKVYMGLCSWLISVVAANIYKWHLNSDEKYNLQKYLIENVSAAEIPKLKKLQYTLMSAEAMSVILTVAALVLVLIDILNSSGGTA